jgi:hypothetical protein
MAAEVIGINMSPQESPRMSTLLCILVVIYDSRRLSLPTLDTTGRKNVNIDTSPQKHKAMMVSKEKSAVAMLHEHMHLHVKMN